MVDKYSKFPTYHNFGFTLQGPDKTMRCVMKTAIKDTALENTAPENVALKPVILSKKLINAIGKVSIILCSVFWGAYVCATEPSLRGDPSELLPPTTSSSSLWVLANQFEVKDATHWQKMVALFQKNPQRFVDNNLNRLKKGVQLTIPSSEEVYGVTRREAQRVYADSLARFNNQKGGKRSLLDSDAESRRLQAELKKSQNNILQFSDKNVHLSQRLQELEDKAQSQIEALDLKNQQLESIRLQLEKLEAHLGEKGEI